MAADDVLWDEQLSTGDLDVDAQHRQLFELVGSMEQQIADGRGHEAVRDSIDDLAEYARSHFSFEESLMERVGYPGLPAHEAQHRAFAEEVTSLRDQLVAGQFVSPRGLLDYLRSWLVHHIAVEDRRIGEHIRATAE